MHTYTYVTLRYVHDTTSGEFVNVGVAVFCPEKRFLGAKCRRTYGRISKVFPGVDGEAFKGALRSIEARFAERARRFAEELPIECAVSVREHALAILPDDDSALQWSSVGGGLTNDPETALERLFERMVHRYDEKQNQERRSDDEVWRNFKRDLESRHILDRFEPKRIASQDDEVEFQHAWKNGVWHCLEPLSFDLSSAETIRDKAHRWLGQLTSLRDAPERFKVYLLLGAPQQDQLRPAFERAVKILGKIPVQKEIYLEDDAPILGRLLEAEIERHYGFSE